MAISETMMRYERERLKCQLNLLYGTNIRKIRRRTRNTRIWANTQRDGRPAEYRWYPLFNAAKIGWRPLLECRAVTLPKEENARLGRKVNVAPGKIPLRGKNPRKCIHSVPAQETAKHRANFGWLPLSDVAAVTKRKRETRWKFLGCPN